MSEYPTLNKLRLTPCCVRDHITQIASDENEQPFQTCVNAPEAGKENSEKDAPASPNKSCTLWKYSSLLLSSPIIIIGYAKLNPFCR